MNDPRWVQVDEYINGLLIPPDTALAAALAESERAGLPSISVSPAQGKLLHLIARAQGARHILEVGTLGGYSAIWLARALPPGGTLTTLESNAKHADVARANLARAGLSERVDVRVGDALETLPQLAEESRPPFDFTFIDADKKNNAPYFQWALKMSRTGSLILVDNVIRGGAVVDGFSTSADVLGVRRLNELMAKEPRISATEVQTVGMKGYDGFALALVTEGFPSDG